MKGAARLFFGLAIIYAVIGMALGIHMASSHTYTQAPVHAHIMVAGWLMSSVFAIFYHLFPAIGQKTMATVHFAVQAVSGIVLLVSLFFVLGGNTSLEPITGIASFGFLAGMLIFAWNALPVLKSA